MAVQQCPKCAILQDVSRNMSGKLAVPGDVFICPSCGGILSFTLTLSVRSFTSEEIRRLEADDPMTYAHIKDKSDQALDEATKPERQSRNTADARRGVRNAT